MRNDCTLAGVTDEVPFRNMSKHISENKMTLEVDASKVTGTAWYKADFEGTSSNTKNIEHKVEVSIVFVLFWCKQINNKNMKLLRLR